MSSVGRWVLTHTELEATTHAFFYLSSSWKDSPFEVGSAIFVCWPESQDWKSLSLLIPTVPTEDGLRFGGGDVNLYAYAGNSSTNLVDPSGQSNSFIHIAETYLGARDAGGSFGSALGLALNSALADVGTQELSSDQTNLHAMAGVQPNGIYQSKDDAYEGTQRLVQAFAGENDSLSDAFAIHAIEDSYSGSHNYLPDGSSLTGIFPSHAFPDAVYNPAARDAVANYLRDRLHGRLCDAKKYLRPPDPGPPALLAVEPLPL